MLMQLTIPFYEEQSFIAEFMKEDPSENNREIYKQANECIGSDPRCYDPFINF